MDVLEDRNLPSFFTPPTFAVGTSPVGQAVGDFNGDGHADLAVANQGSNTVSVLLSNGSGSFAPKTDYATGTTPVGVAVGDFNGDGNLDLAVANFGSKSVSILLGNGDGTFRPKTDLALATSPVSLTVADLNGDGKLDLVAATEDLANDYVNVLKGNGDGTFQVPVSTVSAPAGKGAAINLEPFSTIRAGDFNGDGKQDVVVVNNDDGFNPRGGFFFSGGTVSVIVGNGDGTLQTPKVFGVGTSPRTVAAGDFNGDGRLDFAVGNYMSGTVSVFMNTGGGNFSPSTLAPGGSPFALAAGDFNGDGRADLAVAYAGGVANLLIYAGQAGGSVQATASYFASYTGGMIATDLIGDGHLDLVGVDAAVNAVGFLLNNGDGTFPAPFLINNPGAILSSQAVADFNGDGIPDLSLPGLVMLGLGDGNYGDVTGIMNAGSVAAVDVDGNGTADILESSQNFFPGKVALLLNSPGWDNRTGGAVGFTVSAPQQVTAGANFSVTVTAVDAAGNPVPGFHGTVDLDNSALGSTSLGLLQQYSFTAADAGRHTFVVSGLTKAGLNTMSVYAVAMPTVSTPVTVVPAALAKFAFAAPASVTAGTAFSYTVTAEDAFGNVETGYTGTVHFTASSADSQAVLPADYTFTAADAGAHTFGATLFRTQSVLSPTTPVITATDAVSHITTSAPMPVLSLAPNSLTMVGLPGAASAGQVMQVIVAALDVYGNAATGYTGTVHFSSSDPQASLPADATFTAGVGGADFFFITLKTAGVQSLTVADTANPALTFSQPALLVVPGAPSVWTFAGMPTTTTAGAAQTFTLIAQDAYGNLATNYRGTLSFSSTDSQASLPFNYTFTAADAGRHAFTIALRTAGTQSLTVTDIFGFAFPGTLSRITVTAAAAASVQLAGFPTATTAGAAQTFTVTLRDAFGNIATGYTGTVAFSSSDPIAGLPAGYTFTAADAGVHTFTAAPKRAGTQSITLTDTAVPTLTATEGGIVVSAAAVSQFAISGPTTVTRGVGFKIMVTAEDAFGNVVTGYRGTVHLSSTDATGGTQNFTFSNNHNGVHIFSYTFNALGFQTLTVADTTNSSILGTFTTDVLAQTNGGGGGGGGGTGGP